MKIWLDDIRIPPEGYTWCKSVNEAIRNIENHASEIDLLDCDHDLGDYAFDGGDGIKLLDYLEMHNYNFPIRLHTMNTVGRLNMQRVIRRNGWKEVR